VPFACPACDRSASISVWAYTINLLFLVAAFVVPGFFDRFAVKMAFLGLVVILMLLVFLVVPLTRR
jgi:hypothetical protein